MNESSHGLGPRTAVASIQGGSFIMSYHAALVWTRGGGLQAGEQEQVLG